MTVEGKQLRGTASQEYEARREAQERKDRAGRRGDILRLVAMRLVVALSFLGAWEFLSRNFIDPFWIGQPSGILAYLWEWANDGTLLKNLRPTVTAALIGFSIGGLIGALSGFLFGVLRRLGDVLSPFVTAIYTLPKVALAPVVILWFGIGINSKIALAALLVFFLVFFNTYSGVRQVDRDLVDAVRLMSASRAQIVRYVIIPNAAAWVFVGLRLALPYGVIGAVVGEMLASNLGMGFLLINATNHFSTNQAFAALAVLMVVGVSLNAVIQGFEGRTQRWQPQNNDGGSGQL